MELIPWPLLFGREKGFPFYKISTVPKSLSFFQERDLG
jgi:hypothetical protein